MASKKQKRRKGRLRCPRCGNKKLGLLNKEQQIWECLTPNCCHKFMYIKAAKTYLALKDKDLEIISNNKGKLPVKVTGPKLPEKQKEQQAKDVIEPQTNALDNFLEGF